MGSGTNANQIARGKLRDENERLREQKEELINQVALERTNSHRANIVLACLVKRLAEHEELSGNDGWTVLVTDEEIEAMDGELLVDYDMTTCALTLKLLKKEEPEQEVAT